MYYYKNKKKKPFGSSNLISKQFADIYIPDQVDGDAPQQEEIEENEEQDEANTLYEYDEEDVKSQDPNISLFLACNQSLEKVASIVEKNKSLVNCTDVETPLHEAAKNGKVDIVRYLVSRKAKIDSYGIFKRTPLQRAAEKGFLRVVQILAENGANVNHITKFRSSLHFAVEGRNKFIVEYLLSKGCNVNAADCTPVHLAAEKGYNDIVKYLLLHGAKWDVLDIEKQSPGDVARSNTRHLFDRVTVFKFSFGQNESNEKNELKKKLKEYKNKCKKLLKELDKKEIDNLKKKIKK